jgi:hypothetical protein
VVCLNYDIDNAIETVRTADENSDPELGSWRSKRTVEDGSWGRRTGQERRRVSETDHAKYVHPNSDLVN